MGRVVLGIVLVGFAAMIAFHELQSGEPRDVERSQASVVVSASSLAVAPVDPSELQAANAVNPSVRMQRLLDEAVAEKLLDKAKTSALIADWKTVALGDLPLHGGFEEALLARSVARGDLEKGNARALASLAVRCRAADLSPLAAQAPQDAADWVATLMRWLPRAGGLALSGGLFWLLKSELSKANWVVRAMLTFFLSVALWIGAWGLYCTGADVGASALVLGGCVASAGALSIWEKELNYQIRPLWFGLRLAALWGGVGHVLGSSAAGYLAALALAAGFGSEDRVGNSEGRRWRASAIGLLLVALGYGARGLGPQVRWLVYPCWLVGLTAMFTGSALGWRWRSLVEGSRWVTVLLAAATLLWGIFLGQGVFVGAGGVALVVWGLLLLVELIPSEAPTSLTLTLMGAVMVGLTLALEANWSSVVRLVSQGSP